MLGGLGLGSTFHRTLFQCSISVWQLGLFSGSRRPTGG